jgi:hypothetical protein
VPASSQSVKNTLGTNLLKGQACIVNVKIKRIFTWEEASKFAHPRKLLVLPDIEEVFQVKMVTLRSVKKWFRKK